MNAITFVIIILIYKYIYHIPGVLGHLFYFINIFKTGSQCVALVVGQELTT